MLTVIAEYRAKPGSGDEVAAALARHVAETRAEPGCLGFVANRSREDADAFVLVEQYLDDGALEAHRDSPHFRRNVLEVILPLLDERRAALYDAVEPPGSS